MCHKHFLLKYKKVCESVRYVNACCLLMVASSCSLFLGGYWRRAALLFLQNMVVSVRESGYTPPRQPACCLVHEMINCPISAVRCFVSEVLFQHGKDVYTYMYGGSDNILAGMQSPCCADNKSRRGYKAWLCPVCCCRRICPACE